MTLAQQQPQKIGSLPCVANQFALTAVPIPAHAHYMLIDFARSYTYVVTQR